MTKRTISKKEHIAIVILSGLFLAIVIAAITYDLVRAYNSQILDQQLALEAAANQTSRVRLSGSSPSITFAGMHLLIIPIFLSIVFGKKFVLALLLAFVHTALFFYSFVPRYWKGGLGSRDFAPEHTYIQMFRTEATAIDYVALVFLSMLVIWLMSIVIRTFKALKNAIRLE